MKKHGRRWKRTSSLIFGMVLVTTIATVPGILRGSMPAIPTETWVATGQLSGPRAGASAVLGASGEVLVTGGAHDTDAVASVEAFGGDGSLRAMPSMHEARMDHTASRLADGRVLVIGGRNALGALGSAEILDDGGWTPAGGLADARWGHTATVLADGRVLIAGGENTAGALLSLEIYDPETGTFSVAGTTSTARKAHAAARLSDGRVIIAGGGTDGAVLETTEIFDPATMQLSAGPSLQQPRFGLTATTLLDGRVLFVGGHNGTSNVASAEIYSDVTNAVTYTASASPMVARRFHQAFLLPNNNAVLIVGGIAEGTVDGAAVERETSAAELYLPWLNEVRQTGGMTVARSQASGSALSGESYGAAPAGDGLLMVAGGAGQTSSEVYRFATIRTDKDDYAPGDKVYVSGSGWQPNEPVTFALRELPAEHASRSFTIDADEFGRIESAFLFDVEEHHLGVRFHLTSRGAASQAQVTFTDGNVNVRTVGVAAAATVTWARYSNTACSGAPDAAGTISAVTNGNGTGIPGGATSSQSLRLTAASTVSGASFANWTGDISTPPPDTNNPICVTGENPTRHIQVNYLAISATTMTVVPASGTFGGSVSLSASLTAGSAGLAGKSIQFSLNGSSVGTATTGASGEATLTGVTLSGIDAGVYPTGLAADFSGDGSYSASNATAALTVGAADQTITFGTLAAKTYGDAPFTLGATATSELTVSFASTTPTTCAVAGTSLSMLAAGTCTIRASQAGDTNYNAAPDVDRSFAIGKATPILTATGGTFTYTGAQHAGSGSAVGVDDEQLEPVTLSYTGTGATVYGPTADAPTGAGSYSVTATFAGNDNYEAATSAPAALTIAKANATIDVQGANVTYDGQAHGATGSATGVLGEPLSGLDLGASFTNVPGGTANWTFTDSTGNYNGATGSVEIAIGKANATIDVQGGTVTYDGQPHGATGNATGVLGEPLSGLDLGASFTNVPGGTANWTFTDTTGNYNDASGSVEIAISKANATIDVQGANVSYDGQAHGAIGTATGVIGEDLTSLLTLGDSFTDVPGGTANWSFAGDVNYNASSGTAAIVITPRPASVTADPQSKIYGDANPALTATVTGAVNDDALAYTLATTATQFSGVGSYPITVTLGTNANYTVTSSDGTLAITPRAVTVTADPQSKIYGDANPALTATVTGAVNDDALAYTLATTAVQFSGVGSYPITVTVGTNANYTVTSSDGSLAITPRPASVTADPQSKIYGDANPALTATVTGAVNDDALAYTLATTAVQFSGVGSYPITVTLGTNPNYTVTATDGSLEITPRPASVTADPQSKVYGDANPALTATVTGAVNDDVLAYTLATTALQFSGVGSYPITVTLGTNANYTVTAADGSLEITARAITLTADAKSKVYGDADPALTYQVTVGTVVNGDAFDGALTRAAGENVGTYAIQQGTLEPSPNYALTFTGSSLEITPRAVTVTADAQSKIYGEGDPTLTYQITDGSLAFSDAFGGALARVAGENVGPYAIEQGTLALTSNYTLSYVAANLTITPRAVTVTADVQSKIYGEADPVLTYQITNGSLVSGDAFSGALTRVAGENVGPYAIEQGALALTSNYTLSYVAANLTITPRAVTVTADAQSKIYGEGDPALTYQITDGSLAFSDAFGGALARVAGENVGPYAIQQGTLALSANYALTYAGANLTITPRAVTVTADAQSKIYGEADPALTYQITNGSLAFSDAFSGALTRVAGENVGPYAIAQGTLALSANYALTYAGANLTITPRAVTVKADDKVKLLNGADPALTYQISAGTLVNGDTFSGALTRVAGEAIGAYAIQQGTLALSGNYTLTFVPGTLKIAYRWDGFLQPITNTAHDQHATAIYSSFKAGQTIPAKFELKDANGNVVLQPGNPTFSRTGNLGGCASAEVPADLIGAVVPDSDGLYKVTGSAYHYGWNTKGLQPGLYIIFANLADGTQRSAAICLTR